MPGISTEIVVGQDAAGLFLACEHDDCEWFQHVLWNSPLVELVAMAAEHQHPRRLVSPQLKPR